MTEIAEPRFINRNAFDVHVPDPETQQMLTVRPYEMRESRRYPESAIFVVTGKGFKKHVSSKGPLWPFPGEGVARSPVAAAVIEGAPKAPPEKTIFKAPVKLAESLGSLEVPTDIANAVVEAVGKTGVVVADMEMQALMAYVLTKASGEDASLPGDRFLGMASYLDKIADEYEMVEEPEDEESEEDDDEPKEEDLSELTKAQLVALAKSLNITGTGRMNKSELLDAITEARE